MDCFNDLPLREKLKLIKLCGCEISRIRYRDYSVVLLRMDQLFIEEHVENDSKKIISLSAISHLDLLKYLPHVNFKMLIHA